METNERELICYNLLCDVFIDNAYSSLQLNSYLSKVPDEKDKAYISRLFYGVIEKNITLEYIIHSLVDRKAKTSVEVLLKMGLYRMRYMSGPVYAAINETVELAKRVGKGGVSGFINAVLRKSENVTLPVEGDQATILSINYSVPEWICKKLINEYDYEFTKRFLSYEPNQKTHIRHNSRLLTVQEFERNLEGFEYEKSKLGYYVGRDVVSSLNKSTFTVQSLASMIAANCYLPSGITSPVVLDLCGAPGGKSVYLEELCPSATIYCCDLHPHRVELIKKYIRRMKSNVKAILSDASKIFPEWVNRCDIVICDVPCSGLGVYKSKPDILFYKKQSDIDSLQKVQRNILDNAKNYVKVGGVLCYSTCTVFKEENEDNINDFLASGEFVLDKIECPLVPDNGGMVKLMPHIDGCDGFFIARMRRIK